MAATLAWQEFQSLIAAEDYVQILIHNQQQSLNISLYPLETNDVATLLRICPQIYHQEDNMEFALCHVIEQNNPQLLAQLLEICQKNEILKSFNLGKVFACAGTNEAMISQLIRVPMYSFSIAVWYTSELRPLILQIIQAELSSERLSNPFWCVLQLEYLIDPYFNPGTISPTEIVNLIKRPEIQQQLREHYFPEFRIDNAQNESILQALLETPKIFQTRLSNANDAMMQHFIHKKMQNLSSASAQDLDDYYLPIFCYYLDNQANKTREILQLLEHQALLCKIEAKFCYTNIYEKITAGEHHYKLLLKQPNLLKNFLTIALQTMNNELMARRYRCSIIENIQIAYKALETTTEIWDAVDTRLPALQQELTQLDQSQRMTDDLKQLLKNILHLLASIMTMGYHYNQRRRQLGQCFFKSSFIEQQVKLISSNFGFDGHKRTV